jgi:hypothetical protein
LEERKAPAGCRPGGAFGFLTVDARSVCASFSFTDGRLVRNVKATFADNCATVDLSDLPPGMYVLAGVTGKVGQ